MAIHFFVGESAALEIELKDQHNQRTVIHDYGTPPTWTLSHPDAMQVSDTDMNPLDARLNFVAPTPDGEEATIRVHLDGDPSEGVRDIDLITADTITVGFPPPGEAVSGELRVLRMVVEEPAPGPA